MAGLTYNLALQNISLKRFRLRYSVVSDCYYLHWDQTVCPQLARIEGLAKGAAAVTGVTRYTDQEGKTAHLGLSNGEMSGEIEWKLDFSHSGLAVKSMTFKAESAAEDGGEITHVLTGDGVKVANSSHFGGRTAEVPQMCGHSVISIKTVLTCASKDAVLHFLPGGDPDSCPLDVTIELMVPRKADVYIGEILLGLKYRPQKSCDREGDIPQLDVEEDSGQLHVHIVEGAGICSEDTHQPFNTFVKCTVLPESEHSCPPKQTSPRQNVYPTWTKEFVFPGLSKTTLMEGGIEVILYDYHRLHSNVNIGGLRLCIPKLASPVVSPESLAREASLILFGQSAKRDFLRPLSIDESSPTQQENLHQLPRSVSSHLNQHLTMSYPSDSSLLKRRETSFPQLSQDISHSLPRYFHLSPQPSPRSSPRTSPRSSPRTSPKNSPKNSPRNSLYAGRKSPIAFLKNLQQRSSGRSTPVNDTGYIHWWMDSTITEVQHWRDVLEWEGRWVYCWHVLRPKLQSASSS